MLATHLLFPLKKQSIRYFAYCIQKISLYSKHKLVNKTTFRDDNMNDLNKDVLIGLIFVIGIWSFISGQFVISTVLFAGAAIYSNIVMRAKRKN